MASDRARPAIDATRLVYGWSKQGLFHSAVELDCVEGPGDPARWIEVRAVRPAGQRPWAGHPFDVHIQWRGCVLPGQGIWRSGGLALPGEVDGADLADDEDFDLAVLA